MNNILVLFYLGIVFIPIIVVILERRRLRNGQYSVEIINANAATRFVKKITSIVCVAILAAILFMPFWDTSLHILNQWGEITNFSGRPETLLQTDFVYFLLAALPTLSLILVSFIINKRARLAINTVISGCGVFALSGFYYTYSWREYVCYGFLVCLIGYAIIFLLPVLEKLFLNNTAIAAPIATMPPALAAKSVIYCTQCGTPSQGNFCSKCGAHTKRS